MKYILLLVLLFSCSPEPIEVVDKNFILKQRWTEVNYPNNSITINDSIILQTGFPLVKGFNIKYEYSNDIYYCKYINLLGYLDSFKLHAIQYSNNKITLELTNHYFTHNIDFIK